MENPNVMKSSAASENRSKRVLVEIVDLGVHRQLDLYRYRTFRDSFVAFFRLQKTHQTQPVPVLQGISLTLRAGDRLAVLGANGAGKSTLCRCIAKLMPYDQGTVRTFGSIRAIFETQLAVQAELTGRENGHFLGDFLYPHLDKKKKRLMVEEALEFSGLGAYLDAPFKTYSYGMQTRLGLSILSSAPSDILVLDEVFQGADRGFQKRIAERFNNIIALSGAVVFVSHSPDEIREVCNRVLVLDQGRQVYIGGVPDGIAKYEELCHLKTQMEIEPAGENEYVGAGELR
jgi:ABC-type polysaccharide/polyol phosphate transport system ATPase subunit